MVPGLSEFGGWGIMGRVVPMVHRAVTDNLPGRTGAGKSILNGGVLPPGAAEVAGKRPG